MPKPRPAANNPVRICFTLDIRTESAGFCTLQTQEMFNSLQPLNNCLFIHFLGSAEKADESRNVRRAVQNLAGQQHGNPATTYIIPGADNRRE
jgi:hypothetical protein